MQMPASSMPRRMDAGRSSPASRTSQRGGRPRKRWYAHKTSRFPLATTDHMEHLFSKRMLAHPALAAPGPTSYQN